MKPSRSARRSSELVADAPRPRFHRTAKGRLVVKGLAAEVARGSVLVIDGQEVTIASCGRSWVGSDGCEWIYGYLAETEAERDETTRRECLECGAVEGIDVQWIASHGMGCQRCG